MGDAWVRFFASARNADYFCDTLIDEGHAVRLLRLCGEGGAVGLPGEEDWMQVFGRVIPGLGQSSAQYGDAARPWKEAYAECACVVRYTPKWLRAHQAICRQEL